MLSLRRFRIEGGPPGLRRETFISQDCPYFKIDVEFKAGVPARNQDVIVKVSKPYVLNYLDGGMMTWGRSDLPITGQEGGIK